MKAKFLPIGQRVLAEEAKALELVSKHLDTSFEKACERLVDHKGKVIFSGIGKSGRIAQKIASTFCSTGTPAVFLHAGEAMHGDLGIYQPGDPSILISKSGSTVELLRLLPLLKDFESPTIAIVGNMKSPLAKQADYALDATVPAEADALGIVPSSSALVTLGLGDALAIALMEARGFEEKDFARFHPAGQLGRNLLLSVSDVMHKAENVAVVAPDSSVRDAVIAMTEHPLGAACVTDKAGILLGIITDGDIRRVLRTHENISALDAQTIMTAGPLSINPEASLGEAAKVMEDRPSQISVLPVVDEQTKCLGLLRIHDIYQPNLL